MKSEIFAVSLLRISPRAQKLFLDLFGGRMSSVDFDLIRYLAQPSMLEDLEGHFQCQREEVFSELVEKINQDALEKPASVVFTKKHLANLMDQTKVIRYLTEIVQCDQNEIFDELFDIPKVLDYIYNVSPEVVKKWLLVHVKEDNGLPPGKLIFKHLLQANIPRILDRDWGRFLDDHQWLRSKAMAKIRGALSYQGYILTTDSKTLATMIDESYYRDEAGGVHLDSLAVLHIQRQVAWIVRQMTDHAIEQLDEALKLSNSAEALVNLHKHIEAYELKRPASIWAGMLNFTLLENITEVKDLKRKFLSVTFLSTGAKGVPEVGIKMTARHESILAGASGWMFWSWKKKKPESRIVVSCKLMDKAEPVDVLICKLDDPSQIDLFIETLSQLQFITLESDATIDIGNFILSQNGSSNFQDRMKYLLFKLRPGIIQGLMLTGCDIPNSVAPVWDRDLEYKLPISQLEHRKDTRFPLDRNQILQTLQDDPGLSNVLIIEKIGRGSS